MLGFAADHLKVEWFPAGSFIIEQGEPAAELFCILSGSVVVVVEQTTASMRQRGPFGAGCFVGEDGLASGLPRNAHVIARDDVTCLVLAPKRPSRSGGRGGPSSRSVERSATSTASADHGGRRGDGFSVDVTSALDRKVAALAAHRSQYAMDPDLLPRSMLERLLGTEHFVVAAVAERLTLEPS